MARMMKPSRQRSGMSVASPPASGGRASCLLQEAPELLYRESCVVDERTEEPRSEDITERNSQDDRMTLLDERDVAALLTVLSPPRTLESFDRIGSRAVTREPDHN